MEEEEGSRGKVEIIGTDRTSQTFVLQDEDHTLGNALRYVLVKNPDVKFCGYSIPHPSENVMNIRVETFGKPAAEVFKKALVDLRDISRIVKIGFSVELEGHRAMKSDD